MLPDENAVKRTSPVYRPFGGLQVEEKTAQENHVGSFRMSRCSNVSLYATFHSRGAVHSAVPGPI